MTSIVERHNVACRSNRYEDISANGPQPLCYHSTFECLVCLLHILSKLALVIADIVYLVVTKQPDDDDQENGRALSYMLTYIGSIYEIALICVVPIGLYLSSKCKKSELNTLCATVRYGDLQCVLILAPIFSVHPHYLGGIYWIFIVVRIFFCCTTFVAVVILGIRFRITCMSNCLTLVDMMCCSSGEEVEIKDIKHLLKDVGLKLVTIVLKIFTGSSALATFFHIGYIQEPVVKYSYLGFTILSCVVAAVSALYNAILLRWAVLKEDNMADDSNPSKIMNFLKFKAPCSHFSFVLGFCTNAGLVALNSYILAAGNLKE